MDLKDLQNTWNQYSSREKTKELDEDAIQKILKNRTKSVLEKIDRNIRIGIIVLFLLVLFFVLDDTVISPFLLKGFSGEIQIPGWLIILDIITNLVIITTFGFFVFHYYQAKKKCDIACDLKNTLIQIIRILNLYKRLFFLAIVFLLLATATSYIAGMYAGYNYKLDNNTDVEINLILTIFLGMVVLIVLVSGIFYLFRWSFNRLYGNYLQKLKLTLQELDEVE